MRSPTSLGYSLFISVSAGVTSPLTVLQMNQLNEQSFWQIYFHNILISDLEYLQDLKGVIELLYKDEDAPESALTLGCCYAGDLSPV